MLNLPEIVNDSRARLVEDVIKLTVTNANTGVRRTGKIISEAYKSFLPENVERLVLNVPVDDVSHIPSSFMSSMSPTTKKHLKVQVAAVSWPTSRVLSRGHLTTSLHAQNIVLEKCQTDPPILSALSAHEMYAQ